MSIFGLLMAACLAQYPEITRIIFKEIFENKNEEYLFKIPLLVIGLLIVSGISRYIHIYTLKITVEKITVNIRKKLQRKFLDLNLSFHASKETGTGGLLSQTLNDVNIVHQGFFILADIVREPLIATYLVAYIFYIDWKLATITFVIAPILILILGRIAKGLRKHAVKQLDVLEEFTEVLKESLDGIRVIKSFNLEKRMKDELDEVGNRYVKTRGSILRRIVISSPILEITAGIVLSGILVYCGYQVVYEGQSSSTFIAFITALAGLQPSIKKIQDGYVKLQQTYMAIKRIDETLKNNNIIEPERINKKFPTNWQKISFKNLGFSYGDKKILQDINIDIQRGQVIALVGASGSGKSTIANLLPRFFDPSLGHIFIDQTDIKDISIKDLRQNIGLVTQDVFLFNTSIRQNIQFGDLESPNKRPIEDCAELANAKNFIHQMPDKFETNVGERGSKLSGGERQRVSIARAIYKDAPILILDEATSALDSASEIEVQKALDQLMKGKTTIVIAHRLSTIINADRILVLKDGQIVEDGKHQDLLNLKGEYHTYYHLQSR